MTPRAPADRPYLVAPSSRLRVAVGAVIGLGLLVLVLSRVDLGAVVGHLAGASPAALGIAVAVVLVDLAVRGLRWRTLLQALPGGERVGPALPVAYLTIGYLANVLLPARLGDLARAYLGGAAFRRPRLAILGTIVVERLADGLTMLGLAVLSSLLVTGVATVQALAVYGALLAAAGAAGLVGTWWLLTRAASRRTAVGRVAHEIAVRLARGTAALRTPAGTATVVLATVGAATTAVLGAWIVAGAVGVSLTAAEAVLFMSAVALSLAIPAAPGSLGTYEFVGVVVLTNLGHGADRALATMVLLRAVSTFPPIALGIVSTWALHLRPGAILAAAGTPGDAGGAAEPTGGTAEQARR